MLLYYFVIYNCYIVCIISCHTVLLMNAFFLGFFLEWCQGQFFTQVSEPCTVRCCSEPIFNTPPVTKLGGVYWSHCVCLSVSVTVLLPVCLCVCDCSPVSVCVWCKLQALVYDILPSTTAIFSYAIGPENSANEQFFVDAQTVVSLLQTTQIKQGVWFIAANKVHTSTNKTTIVWIETELFFFNPGWKRLMFTRVLWR